MTDQSEVKVLCIMYSWLVHRKNHNNTATSLGAFHLDTSRHKYWGLFASHYPTCSYLLQHAPIYSIT